MQRNTLYLYKNELFEINFQCWQILSYYSADFILPFER